MRPIDQLRGRAVARLQSVPRRARRRLRGRPVRSEDFRVLSGAGYRIAGSFFLPAGGGRLPGVVLCPGTDDGAAVFEGWTQPLNAIELAATGVCVACFDPAGRGRSWGPEDYGGLEHQDDLRVVLRQLAARPEVDAERIGVVAISLGLAMACGALARWGDELPVSWLLDWEGPSDREIMTAGGRIMEPALGHGLDDEVYWRPREAVRHVGSLRCGYLRIQSERDHAQPGEFRHAMRMIQAAASGDLPWFRLNDHPRGLVPAEPAWVPPGRLAANRVLLREIAGLLGS